MIWIFVGLESYNEYYEQLNKLFGNVRTAIYVVCAIICLFTLVNMLDLTKSIFENM